MLPPLHALRRLAVSTAFLGVATLAHAGQPDDVFTFKDWEVACDNTRHCEAAGFQAEDDADHPVALWIARDAGPGAPVTTRLSVQDDDTNPEVTLLRVSIGGAPGLSARNGKSLDAAAFFALPHLLDAASADVVAGKQHFTLSLDGLKAALLKMDDLQGRLDTPGALLRKGTRPEAAVPPPRAAPRLHGTLLPPNLPSDAALLQSLLKSGLKDLGSACEDATQSVPSESNTKLQRVSATQVILVHECDEGYNSPSDIWLAADRPPHAVQPAVFTAPAGLADDTDAYVDAGLLKTLFKGRGINDCASRQSWLWTGKRFELAEATEAPLCRGFASNEVNVRVWTTTR